MARAVSLQAGAHALPDNLASAVVSQLHDLSERQSRSLPVLLHNLRRRWRTWSGRPLDWDEPVLRRFLSDKLVALDREKCRLCYLLCRSAKATRIVEIGTSFGVSTIYLAAAARENSVRDSCGGLVIGTEIDIAKAAAARANVANAGLAEYVEIREGDFRMILRDLHDPIDFVLLDIWAPLARPAIEVVAPHLRAGAVIVCDNIVRFSREYRDYLSFVHDPLNGFWSTTLSLEGGLELSVRRV